jgi:hypothetical protein
MYPLRAAGCKIQEIDQQHGTIYNKGLKNEAGLLLNGRGWKEKRSDNLILHIRAVKVQLENFAYA